MLEPSGILELEFQLAMEKLKFDSQERDRQEREKEREKEREEREKERQEREKEHEEKERSRNWAHGGCDRSTGDAFSS
jgi:hypothetical protein